MISIAISLIVSITILCVAILWVEKSEAEKKRMCDVERERIKALAERKKIKEEIEGEMELRKQSTLFSPSKIDEYEYGLNLQCSTDNKLSLSIEDKFDLLLEHLGLKIEENKIEFKPYKIVSKKKSRVIK